MPWGDDADELGRARAELERAARTGDAGTMAELVTSLLTRASEAVRQKTPNRRDEYAAERTAAAGGSDRGGAHTVIVGGTAERRKQCSELPRLASRPTRRRCWLWLTSRNSCRPEPTPSGGAPPDGLGTAAASEDIAPLACWARVPIVDGSRRAWMVSTA